MSETELTVYEEQSGEIMLPDDLDLNVAGQENLEDGDVGMPPRLRVSSQNRPIENTSPGQIVNTLTGAIYDAVDFVPMVFLISTRAKWPLDFNADNIPLCVSDDGEYPVQDMNRVSDPMTGPCAMCPDAQFGPNGEAPRCKKQRNFLVSILPDHEPAIITLSSTGIAPAKHLTALAKMTGIRKAVTMATKLVSNDKGNWWLPVFVQGRKLANNEILTAIELRDGLKNLVEENLTADLERENGSAPTGDVVNGTAAPVMYDPDEEMLPF